MRSPLLRLWMVGLPLGVIAAFRSATTSSSEGQRMTTSTRAPRHETAAAGASLSSNACSNAGKTARGSLATSQSQYWSHSLFSSAACSIRRCSSAATSASRFSSAARRARRRSPSFRAEIPCNAYAEPSTAPGDPYPAANAEAESHRSKHQPGTGPSAPCQRGHAGSRKRC